MAGVMYLECASGVAGDMLLAAFLDAGLPVAELRAALGSLGVDHGLRVTKVLRAGVTATHVTVDPLPAPAAVAVAGRADASYDRLRTRSTPHSHPHEPGAGHAHPHGPACAGPGPYVHGEHRSLKDIVHLIGRSALSAAGRQRAVALFRRLAEVEAAIHGLSVDEVHLHEVGAIDSIIDIVGAVFAFEWWGIDDVVASPLNVGGGTVEIAHGTFTVPAPATVRLLAGVPVYSTGATMELVTPTGALLVSDYAKTYGPLPAMTIRATGYGAGSLDRPGVPNVVRVLVGERHGELAAEPDGAPMLRIECEIDDMSPQLFAPVTDRLFSVGAADVFLTPVQMKKGRPGTLLTVLAAPDRREAVSDVLFRETTTIGVRVERVWRETLERAWESVAVPGGHVRIKVARRRGEIVNAAPEFEDCLHIAQATRRPLKEVQAEALAAWQQRPR